MDAAWERHAMCESALSVTNLRHPQSMYFLPGQIPYITHINRKRPRFPLLQRLAAIWTIVLLDTHLNTGNTSNFACCFIRVINVVSQIRGKTWVNDDREKGCTGRYLGLRWSSKGAAENCIMRSVVIFSSLQILLEGSWVGCVRGTCGGEEKGFRSFSGETWIKGATRRVKRRL